MIKKRKIAWVLPGGGNQTAYACGVLLALIKLKANLPEVIITASGGTANTFYFLAGQMKRAEEIWTSKISTKKILNVWRFWKMFDRDAMIDGVFMKKPNELKIDRVSKSPVKIFVGVTDIKSGEVSFFSNKEKINPLSLLKATMAVPFFSGIFKSSSINLEGKNYSDSRISGRYELLAKKAIQMGANKVIIIGGNRGWNYRYFGNFFHNLWLFTKRKEFRLNQKKLEKEERIFNKVGSKKIFYLCPKEKLKIAPWDNAEWQLREIVKKGYDDTLKSSKELELFVKKR
jgi:predicted patatin/cPLA2 family phospholipase